MLSILFGLASALSWGAGDFAGGLASRKTGAYRAVLYGEAIGLALLLLFGLRGPQPIPDVISWIYAVIAGALGTAGILMLYASMVEGKMSIAAPVSALLAAALPVVVGIFTQGTPGLPTFIGFGFALSAVWLVSQSEDGIKDIFSHLADLRLPLLAGVGFGCYFTFMNLATRQVTFWPIVAGRSAGLAVMVLFILFRRGEWRPERAAWPFLILNGVLDVGGNLFYVLAGQTGRLDVSAVLSSLFPGATVLLASLVLKERISRVQWLGVAAALIAIILFTVQ
jgi:drug/metabolite transporter (DMT)-like permease